MIVIPAIDIKEGKVVRLKQGDFNTVTVYSSDPVAIAKHWESKGATLLHVVDLDGAQHGKLRNSELIIKIAQSINIPVQTGGGIRTEKDIVNFLSCGLARVVLGTKVIEDRAFLKDILSVFHDKVVVSLDCSEGQVTQKGWTSQTKLKATEFAKELEATGLKHLVYTDIARDGMLSGPNINAIEEMLRSVKLSVIASGGISNMDDIRALRRIETKNLEGVIVGKALYETRVDLEEVLTLCSQNE